MVPVSGLTLSLSTPETKGHAGHSSERRRRYSVRRRPAPDTARDWSLPPVGCPFSAITTSHASNCLILLDFDRPKSSTGVRIALGLLIGCRVDIRRGRHSCNQPSVSSTTCDSASEALSRQNAGRPKIHVCMDNADGVDDRWRHLSLYVVSNFRTFRPFC